MNWLIDSHVLIWLAKGSERLSKAFLESIRTLEPKVFISSATAWELAMKAESGKLQLPEPVESYWNSRTEALGLVEVPIVSQYALAAAKLPPIHKDPFDRVIAATALVENWTVVTADPVFQRYGCKVIDPSA